MNDATIFALSSGQPPAAIAVLRISGPRATDALIALAGGMVPARKAALRHLRDRDGMILDKAIVLFFPGPASATGEDSVEFHLHGGRAVIAAVERELGELPEFRAAYAGEFTRRAFANGRLDLSEAEGLADLLEAETELQRRNAQSLADGVLSKQVAEWRETVLMLGAEVEAVLDFSDEEDGEEISSTFHVKRNGLYADLEKWTNAPHLEALREGFRVVIAGPPNSGKSSLFNAILREDAAIATPVAGTTRDVLYRPVAIDGIPFQFVDTAGIRDDTNDEIEKIGIERAKSALATADVVLWLGPEGEGPDGALEIETKSDVADRMAKADPRAVVSSRTGAGVDDLVRDLVTLARARMPKPGSVAISSFQRAQINQALDALRDIPQSEDLLVLAERLRVARKAFDRLAGKSDVEAMLDRLFARFCIGK
ncbi:tRNA uridine-5-carboxymethylaminomethyl(34) synthesis GTPase MnmE [Croceicoccus hydrothermalis]|uniref:tRNA uridine-5-carboxymethylaminomethyl(34) synthesis GTPase MnmE n=1 Tax=Croceicoccus hydrothermalis TaxID=2867964 RepID=UPI001EFBB35F|nr:tRNA uridine-5-carboxymethylaminomethyl(34) synthesis GTPase MnmE [Croceicoccus hydrothermalis]